MPILYQLKHQYLSVVYVDNLLAFTAEVQEFTLKPQK